MFEKATYIMHNFQPPPPNALCFFIHVSHQPCSPHDTSYSGLAHETCVFFIKSKKNSSAEIVSRLRYSISHCNSSHSHTCESLNRLLGPTYWNIRVQKHKLRVRGQIISQSFHTEWKLGRRQWAGAALAHFSAIQPRSRPTQSAQPTGAFIQQWRLRPRARLVSCYADPSLSHLLPNPHSFLCRTCISTAATSEHAPLRNNSELHSFP